MDKAKSVEMPDVIKALEGIEVNDLLGRMIVDPATHQTLRPYFFLKCKPKKAMKEARPRGRHRDRRPPLPRNTPPVRTSAASRALNLLLGQILNGIATGCCTP